MKIISIDAETNGLWGQAIQISAVLWEDGVVRTFNGQCPPEGELNEWVKDNVMPYIDGVMYNSYYLLLKDFTEWYKANKENADIIVHVGMPVEARLFIDAHNFGFLGDWDAPFPLIDISAFPEIGVSVDNFNEVNGIEVPYRGNIHNALYDSWAALMAYLKVKGQIGVRTTSPFSDSSTKIEEHGDHPWRDAKGDIHFPQNWHPGTW